MNSLILRVGNLPVLTADLLKSKVLGFHYCNVFRRTISTKNFSVLYSVHRKILNAYDVQKYTLPSNNEQNLSTIVELDVGFEDVKIDGEETSSGSRKVKKRKKQMRAFAQNQNVVEKNNELEKPNVSESEISSNKSKKGEQLFSSIMTKLKSSKMKEKNQKILLEGKRLIHDAISAGFLPEMIFYSRESDVEKMKVPDTVKTFNIPYKSFTWWSDVVTPQGILGVFKMPDLRKLKESGSSIPLTIVCDNIREPGNLGTILRVAAGVGCKKVLLTKGCVNIWDAKVIRAGAGAHFHIPVVRNLVWSDIENEISEDNKVFLADINHQAVNDTSDTQSKKEISAFTVKSNASECLPVHCYSSVKYTNENTVIVIGGETYGLCSEAYEFAAKRKGVRIFIPMTNEIESLNNSVALGILAYEFKRQLNSFEDHLVGGESVDAVKER